MFVSNHHLFDDEPIRVVLLLMTPRVLIWLTLALLCLVGLRLTLLTEKRSWCVGVVQMAHGSWGALR